MLAFQGVVEWDGIAETSTSDLGGSHSQKGNQSEHQNLPSQLQDDEGLVSVEQYPQRDGDLPPELADTAAEPTLPQERKTFETKARQLRAQKKKALLIGVNYTKSPPSVGFGPLARSHQDAESLRQLLIDQYGYKKEDIVLMLDKDDIPSKLQPKRENMIREFDGLVHDAQPGDQFVFSFSGYSNLISNIGDQETDVYDEAIVPMDSESDEPKNDYISDEV
ncbi:hypothetical protein K474DRAFT_1665562 [Panus rudis PR-1116 ss-1]|nr:hypothetical protein K474DRAFT_1665562 [Panus rudis PR-1116 ss-1]